jgi:uncharacterized membrane protein YfcA
LSITDITTWQITALLLTALMTGFAKTGVPAAGILGVTLMASAFAAKESVGILLPMLIAADIVAVIYYRKQVVWKHLISLIPWTLVGIISGYGLMLVIADTHLKLLIGVLVLLLVFVHIYREYKGSLERAPSSRAFGASMGVLAGFATMVGNASGGIMAIYLLSRRLPKEQFVGTGAWFFISVNLIKVPFNISLGIITWNTLLINLVTVPVILIGTWIGIKVLPKISQKQFQWIILALSAAGALQLTVSALLAW